MLEFFHMLFLVLIISADGNNENDLTKSYQIVNSTSIETVPINGETKLNHEVWKRGLKNEKKLKNMDGLEKSASDDSGLIFDVSSLTMSETYQLDRYLHDLMKSLSWRRRKRRRNRTKISKKSK